MPIATGGIDPENGRSVHAIPSPLGTGGLTVSAIDLGCMWLSGIYGSADDAVTDDLIRHAIDCGVDHFDSCDMYGWGHNEAVLGRALEGRRDREVQAIRFGQTPKNTKKALYQPA